MNAMKLIIGLGNPGREYENTRHNAGFMAVDFLAEHFSFPRFKMAEKHKAELAEGEIMGEKMILVKPQTFMNLSGIAAHSIASFYKIPPQDVIVIYDDADLPLGTLRIRLSGSSAGHNGVQSVIDQIGHDFIRIRLGIQPETPFHGELEDYVLGKLTGEEKKNLRSVIEKLPYLIETIIKEGPDEAMQKFN